MKRIHQPPGQVEVQVKGSHLVVTQALNDHVVQKMSKLDRYFDRLQTVEVELCWEHTRDSSQQNRVEAITHVNGRSIRTVATHDDMYAAIDEVVDKLHRTLNRQKERSKAHGSNKITDVLPGTDDLDDSDVSELADVEPGHDDVPVVVRERLDVQPLFEDEAIAEMNAAGLAFYVFLNARTESINVVYRHADGSYGVIEPQGG